MKSGSGKDYPDADATQKASIKQTGEIFRLSPGNGRCALKTG